MTNPIKDINYYMSLPYPILISPPESADDDWFAEIPDLSGCMTQAPSRDELFPMIEEAKRLWLESMLDMGQVIPEPEHSLSKR